MGGVSSAMGKGAPAPPDFTRAAEMQAASGKVNSPFAQWDGNNLRFIGGLGQGVTNLMNQIGTQGSPMTGDAARQQAIDSAYQQSTSRLDPQWDRRESALRVQLANQGLDPSSEASARAMQEFGQQRNDAYGSAMSSAINQGTLAGSALFNQNLQAQMAPYTQLNSLAGLLGANQGRETQYLNAANNAYQGQLQSYGIDQAGKNSLLGGATALGAGYLAGGG